ncbi:MAG: hypothetical protein JSS79_19735 [Bacteroidetes bacterium]|nr:hypothetical protein [Bacteroidota bacterium]
MRSQKTTFFVFFLLLTVGSAAVAQVKKSVRSGKFSVPHVSHMKAKIVCPIFEESQYPYQGIGFKVGDPFALTYKFYPTKHWSFAVDGGKAASGLYNSYYRGLFNKYIPDTLSTDPLTKEKSTMTYLVHKPINDWFLETKFLYQWDAEKISKGLMLYAGLGWQWRNTTLRYDYNYQQAGPFGENRFGHFTKNRFTYGAVAIVGFEYSYFSLPVSAFIEVEMFTDALVDPGYQRFQGGVGLRYVF